MKRTPPLSRSPAAAARWRACRYRNTCAAALGLGRRSVHGAIALDAPPKLLAAQVEDWMRVAITEEERARRAADGCANIGIAAPSLPEPRN